MMLVKAHDGDGNWHLFEAHDDLAFCGPNVMVEVPIDYGEQGPEASMDPERCGRYLPYAEYSHVLTGPYIEGSQFTHVRWVRWLDANGESHRLVTQHSVYICNADGQTVEALR